MGEKARLKKELIRNNARKLFGERGFKEVTMKDVAEACNISRGGLYIYYNSTKEILTDILNMDAEESDDALSDAIKNNASAEVIMGVFFEAQKKELTAEGVSLFTASYEMATMGDEEEKKRFRQRFEDAAAVLEQLIIRGVRSGEFYCNEPRAMARHIMYAIEGLRMSAAVVGIDEKDIDAQLRLMYLSLLYPEYPEEYPDEYDDYNGRREYSDYSETYDESEDYE